MILFFSTRDKARTFATAVKAAGAATASVKDNKDAPSVNGSRFGVAIQKVK